LFSVTYRFIPVCKSAGLGIIDHHHSNRHTTDLCQRLELGAVPYEMFRPVICSRMEEANNLAGIWIEPRNVGPFGAIAVDASEGKILVFACATMLPSDDVIDLEWSRVERRRQLAVFATGAGPLPDLADELRVQCA